MTAHYKCDHVRENSHIEMPIKTSTDGEIIAVPVGNVINQFNLGSKLVGITSDVGTNLVISKDILESTFGNTGLFDLEKPMFVMKFLAHVLDNAYKSGIMDVKYDDGRVDNEVTRRNIQQCFTWTNK